MRFCIGICLLSALLASPTFAVVDEDETLTNKQEKRVLTSKKENSLPKLLKQLYSTHAVNGENSFSHELSTTPPFKLNDLIDLRHPIIKKAISKLTESDLEDIRESIREEKIRKRRVNTILNIAIQFGMESAIFDRTSEFMFQLKDNETALMQTFNYKSLMLAEGKIRPAVIDKVDYTERLDGKRGIHKVK
ncbi:MAG: hypothetical protein HAW67_00340, partial [Endozoicomonadaceae bacterium]|nr:hypothetical protein [Endozoicomonadaceae bacterium]